MITNGCSTKTRAHSADDSMDDLGTDEPGSPYTSLSGNDRKRRRGVIEKRRRDRINCSLADLKRLVPDSNHKPGSSKLEKAEILQLTVDFLQRLHKEGYVLTSEARALELRRYGFKDCLMEVQRLLSTFEGVPISSDDLRRHLLAHLQQSERQRDAEAKSYLAQIAAVTNAMLSQTPALPDANLDSTTCCPQIRSKSAKHQSGDLKSHSNIGKLKQQQPLTVSESLATNPSSPNAPINGHPSYPRDQSGTGAFYSNNYYVHHSTDPRLIESNPRYSSSSYHHHQQQQQQQHPYTMNTVMSNDPIDYHHHHHQHQTLSSSSPYLTKNSCYGYDSNPVSNYTLPNNFLSSSTSSSSSSNATINTTAGMATNTSTTISNSHNAPTTDMINLNANATIGLGQNESQSTSSPPFQSTPDDSDLGLSPLVKGSNPMVMPTNPDLFGQSVPVNLPSLVKYEQQNPKSHYLTSDVTTVPTDLMGPNKMESASPCSYPADSISKPQPNSNPYGVDRPGHGLASFQFDQSPMKTDPSLQQTVNFPYEPMTQSYPYYAVHSNSADCLPASDSRFSTAWRPKLDQLGSLNYSDYGCGWSSTHTTHDDMSKSS